jgi:hypothetical protein
MNPFKKLALSLLLAMPMVACAAGMGVYLPVSVGTTSSVTKDYDSSLFADEDLDVDFKPSAGLGLSFDSNIGKDRLFNYRLGLEFMKQKLDTVNGDGCVEDCDFGTRFNMVHTFGFGVLRTQTVRLWIGPRLNIAYDSDTGDNGYERVGFEFGIAPAVGINVNLGRVVSLAADLDYRFASTAGAWDSDISLDGGSYSGTTRGATARFYLLFRFGEQFQRAPGQPAQPQVIDSSL